MVGTRCQKPSCGQLEAAAEGGGFHKPEELFPGRRQPKKGFIAPRDMGRKTLSRPATRKGALIGFLGGKEREENIAKINRGRSASPEKRPDSRRVKRTSNVSAGLGDVFRCCKAGEGGWKWLPGTTRSRTKREKKEGWMTPLHLKYWRRCNGTRFS